MAAMLLRSRLSSTAVPLAVRAISCLQRNYLDRHFSTDSTTRKIIKAIKSEIKCNDLALKKSRQALATLPFTIEDEPSERHIMLRRAFVDDEKIKVMVSPGHHKHDDSDDDDEEESSGSTGVSSTENSDDDSKEEESSCVDNDMDPPAVVFMLVSIEKENKGTLGFCTHFFPDHEIVVHRLSFTDKDDNPAPSYYMGNDLGGLQRALREFLKLRGIEKANACFLYNYMVQKGKKWETLRDDFKNVKKFIEGW